jgi:Tat protein secretion system quality control protein TatD with DNase activity
VPYVAAELAKIHQCSVDDIGNRSTENFWRLFNIQQ